MSKIPLLTREQEVYLAKKIESAKLNTLRLLSLTTINSFKIMELAEELQPVGAPTATPRNSGWKINGKPRIEVTLEEQNRLRMRQVRRIISRLEKLETQYRSTRVSHTAKQSARQEFREKPEKN